MEDFVEIDFLGVETAKSGDAITIRYRVNDRVGIHVVDGGFIDTGDQIIEHVRKYYGGASYIDNVVLTHSDQDHANGLRVVLETFDVGALWMHRPWSHAAELLQRFPTYNSAASLEAALKSAYASVAALEDIALDRGIPIFEPFQGEIIGPFVVLAPTRARYLDLVASSDKTPTSTAKAFSPTSFPLLRKVLAEVREYIASAWGIEIFPSDGTSAENEMSVVQFSNIRGAKILLTGDAGRDALNEAADFAPAAGLVLPGVQLFQVPHHGGRHNVDTAILDRLLGQRRRLNEANEATIFQAVCSSAKADEHHPRKSVIRAMLHRGAHFAMTEGQTVCWNRGIPRDNWTSLPQTPYPNEQEAD